MKRPATCSSVALATLVRTAELKVTRRTGEARGQRVAGGAGSSPLRLQLLLLGGGDVVHENDNVAFLHDVQFALLSVFASLFDFGHTGLSLVQRFEIVKGTHFGFDEAPFKVGVNDPGRLRGQGAFHNGQARTSFGPAV